MTPDLAAALAALEKAVAEVPSQEAMAMVGSMVETMIANTLSHECPEAT